MTQDTVLGLILRSWSWQPLILLGLGMAAVSYAYAFYHFHRHGQLRRLMERGLIRRSHPYCFASGLLILCLALLSPIDVLADLLFSMHMIQHVLLMMVAPPLILFGLPMPFARWLLLEFKLRDALRFLTYPIVAYALYNVNLILWHLPVLYEAALQNQFIHDVEHALFFYTALFYWWRVIDPTQGWYPLWHWTPAKWFYLIVAAPPSYVLGSILWASRNVLYPHYAQVPRLWELSALADQRYGGILMWTQGWMFLMASMIVFFIWYNPEMEPE